MSRRLPSGHWLSLWVGLILVGPALAQVEVPPPPAEYDIVVRYRIRALRNERLDQYFAMTRALDAAGMVREPGDPGDEADPDAERLRGKVPSQRLAEVMAEPHVRTVLVWPAGAKMPDAAGAMVPVRIDLVRGLEPTRQRMLSEQSRERLVKLGFVEKVGYDHRGFTRLYGAVPVALLPHLLADLRFQPGGWLSPETTPDELPEPIRSTPPLRLIEVVPDPASFAAVADAPAPRVLGDMAKLSPDFLALLATEGGAAKTTRFDVVLFTTPGPEDVEWRAKIFGIGTVAIEGMAGPIVSLIGPAGAAKELAALPEVASVRLPIAASATIPSGGVIAAGKALSMTNLERLHQQSGKGQGVKIAIIDSDFAGYTKLVGTRLPSSTRLIDLTAERHPDLVADSIADDRAGRGSLAAMAAVRAAPDAQLWLIRVDAAAPHHVLTVARAVAGQTFRTEAMNARRFEMQLEYDRLRQSRTKLTADRQEINENYTADEETQKKRLDVQERLIKLAAEENAYDRRVVRFTALEQGLFSLRGASVVACSLNWGEGLPVDGTGPLATFLDGPARLSDRPRGAGPAVWLQSAGDTRFQAWSGPLWDADGNGVLEFARRDMPLPVGKWSRELNFLGWMPHEAATTADLPKGAKVRIVLQWTEAQDADAPIDPLQYRKPLNDLRPVVLRQRDPSGTKVESDDMVVIARSVALPQLLNRTAGGATFEHIIEFTVDAPGRFAVRMEGKAAEYTSPADAPMLASSRKRGEVYQRLSIAGGDPVSREQGRPVLLDFITMAGGMGSPADARTAVVIGAVDSAGQLQNYSARGSAPALALVPKPTLLAPDEFAFGPISARGTSTANGFAAGTVAAMLSAGAPATTDLGWLKLAPGALLSVPNAWLDQLLNTTGLRERAAYLPSPPARNP